MVLHVRQLGLNFADGAFYSDINLGRKKKLVHRAHLRWFPLSWDPLVLQPPPSPFNLLLFFLFISFTSTL